MYRRRQDWALFSEYENTAKAFPSHWLLEVYSISGYTSLFFASLYSPVKNHPFFTPTTISTNSLAQKNNILLNWRFVRDGGWEGACTSSCTLAKMSSAILPDSAPFAVCVCLTTLIGLPLQEKQRDALKTDEKTFSSSSLSPSSLRIEIWKQKCWSRKTAKILSTNVSERTVDRLRDELHSWATEVCLNMWLFECKRGSCGYVKKHSLRFLFQFSQSPSFSMQGFTISTQWQAVL